MIVELVIIVTIAIAIAIAIAAAIYFYKFKGGNTPAPIPTPTDCPTGYNRESECSQLDPCRQICPPNTKYCSCVDATCVNCCSDNDCNFPNGTCVNGSCQCTKDWIGVSCSNINCVTHPNQC